MRESIDDLILEIANCHECLAMDHRKATRDLDKTNLQADVLIISQALAEKTFRLSGISFYNVDHQMGNTGIRLEKFLNLFGRTLDYKSSNCAYSTDLVQCYPGKNHNRKGDRKPTSEEIQRCLPFLKREIELLNPRLILLMGKKSRDAFWSFLLKKPLTPFSESVGTVDYYNGVPVMPIQHASGTNSRFNDMLSRQDLIQGIKKILIE